MKTMNLINSALMESFDVFIKNLKPSDKIAIYHDSDPDGTCSAVIIAKAIEHITGKKIAVHVGRMKNERFVSVELAKKFRSMGMNKIITVDIAADEKPEGLAVAEQFACVLVIDHHKLYCESEMAKLKTLLLKPQLLYDNVDPQLYCTSKFVYDLIARHVDVSDMDWTAAVGVIADITSKAWMGFLKSVCKKYKISLTEDLFESRLGIIARMISSAEVYDEKNSSICFDVLYAAKHPDDVIKSKLAKFQKIIEGEIDYFIKNVKKNAEHHNSINLIFYFVKPKHAIKSPLCTILSFKYPKKTLLVVSEDDGRINVSARRQDKKIAMNNLLEAAIKGFEDANAGGHAAASGAAFPAKYLATFKKRIIEQLSQVST